MDIRNRVNDLREYLLEKVEQENTEKSKAEASFIRGLYTGYAGAYELCAKWLDEILGG